MPGLELLDIAISLVFLYLLLSLICSALAEYVEALLKKRSTNLLQGIKAMFNDPEGDILVEKLYNNAYIFSLFRGEYNAATPNPKNLPSYIPASNFVSALLGVLVPDAEGNDDFDKLKQSIDSIPSEKVRKTLSEIVTSASGNMDKARANLEDWYDSSMERVGGWYKRHAQFVTLTIGLVLAVAFNADTIGVATQLTHDRAMRTAFVAVAQGYAERQATGGPAKDFNQLFDEVKNSPAEIGLPLGWKIETIPLTVGGWVLKLIGWFFTAAAISMGSSFWFDLLKKLINLRSTIKPESSKDSK